MRLRLGIAYRRNIVAKRIPRTRAPILMLEALEGLSKPLTTYPIRSELINVSHDMHRWPMAGLS